MKVDDEVVPCRAKSPPECNVCGEMPLRRNDQVVDVPVCGNDGGSRGFDQISDTGGREMCPDGADGGRGEYDVADFPETNEKDLGDLRM